MTNEEYLRQRIDDLENAVLDESLPLNQRKNQARALMNYRRELEQELLKSAASKTSQTL